MLYCQSQQSDKKEIKGLRAVREDHKRAKGNLTITHAGRQIVFSEPITFQLDRVVPLQKLWG